MSLTWWAKQINSAEDRDSLVDFIAPSGHYGEMQITHEQIYIEFSFTAPLGEVGRAYIRSFTAQPC